MSESKKIKDKIKTSQLFDCKVPYLKERFENTLYPWELLGQIDDVIGEVFENIPEGYVLYGEGVLVGENVRIAATATIEAPAIIGKGTEIRPGAYIRGKVIIGENCVIGNSTELKNCILLDRVQVPHYNYVGDSVLGNHAHLGAGAICSNLKADGKSVVVKGKEEYPTGRRKLGAIVGDNADVGCGCVLNPGTVIGKGTSVYPLTALRGVIPEECIVKSNDNIVVRNK